MSILAILIFSYILIHKSFDRAFFCCYSEYSYKEPPSSRTKTFQFRTMNSLEKRAHSSLFLSGCSDFSARVCVCVCVCACACVRSCVCASECECLVSRLFPCIHHTAYHTHSLQLSSRSIYVSISDSEVKVRGQVASSPFVQRTAKRSPVACPSTTNH